MKTNLQELQEAFNNGNFVTVPISDLIYSFQDTTLRIRGYDPANMVHYKIYEEDSKFFLNTNPSLFGEDLLLNFNHLDAFTLSGKSSGREYLLLKRNILI